MKREVKLCAVKGFAMQCCICYYRNINVVINILGGTRARTAAVEIL